LSYPLCHDSAREMIKTIKHQPREREPMSAIPRSSVLERARPRSLSKRFRCFSESKFPSYVSRRTPDAPNKSSPAILSQKTGTRKTLSLEGEGAGEGDRRKFTSPRSSPSDDILNQHPPTWNLDFGLWNFGRLSCIADHSRLKVDVRSFVGVWFLVSGVSRPPSAFRIPCALTMGSSPKPRNSYPNEPI